MTTPLVLPPFPANHRSAALCRQPLVYAWSFFYFLSLRCESRHLQLHYESRSSRPTFYRTPRTSRHRLTLQHTAAFNTLLAVHDRVAPPAAFLAPMCLPICPLMYFVSPRHSPSGFESLACAKSEIQSFMALACLKSELSIVEICRALESRHS
ncbi:hypothetical protein DFH09DRAFT_1104879 [Mycena vulgaris]|nr:hypothetical protein DFH09DRAFT_1104879 [Mycena vulgaris]